MKTHLIAFFCSLLLHLLLWAGLLPGEGTVSVRSSVYEVALAQGAAEDRPISPAMAGAAAPESHPSNPSPHRQPRQANAPLPAHISKKQTPPARKLAATDANLPRPADPSTPVSGLTGQTPLSQLIPESGPVPSHEQMAQNSLGTPGQRYLRINLPRIRQQILDRMSYPPLARKNGWSGQVRVVFLIEPDGRAADIRILSKSGFGVLDDDAIRAVAKAAPFPPPPEATRIEVPIRYRLANH